MIPFGLYALAGLGGLCLLGRAAWLAANNWLDKDGDEDTDVVGFRIESNQEDDDE